MSDNVISYFPARACQLPSGEAARLETITVSGGDRYVITYDASTNQDAFWTIPYTPDFYQGLGTLKLVVQGCMASATSGNVKMSAALEAVTPADSLDLDATVSFDSGNTSTTAVAGTAGYLFTQTITLSNKDNLVAGDMLRIKLTRLANDAADTATGNLRVLGCSLLETTTYVDMSTHTKLIGALFSNVCQGRLTLESGVAVSSTDQTAKTNIYFTPYKGNQIALYTPYTAANYWTVFSFSELTLPLGTLTSGKNYDLFVWDDSGTVKLVATAWTNDTTRATALTLQDGVYVQNLTPQYRWVGTFRTTATTTTEDSDGKRFLVNAYNTVPRRMWKRMGTAHTYNSTTPQQANADAAMQIELINPWPNPGDFGAIAIMAEQSIECNSSSSSTDRGRTGIGENSTSAYIDPTYHLNPGVFHIVNANASDVAVRSTLNHLAYVIPRTGYSYYALLEDAPSATTISFTSGFGIEAMVNI